MAAVQKPTIISFDALLASYLTRTGSLSVRQLTNAPACERKKSFRMPSSIVRNPSKLDRF